MSTILSKFKEALTAVLPISMVVLILGLLMKMSTPQVINFLIGMVLLIFGMTLFSLGAEYAMVPMGTRVGASFGKVKKHKLLLAIVSSFIIGFLITVAEPDLMVLASQLKGAFTESVIILTVSIGVGILLVVATLRIVFQIKYRTILLVAYITIFTFGALFIPQEFVTIAFDSGGVSTGPITTPIILALGIGVASIKKGSSMDDSFGLAGICSIGPIAAILFLGLFFDPSGITADNFASNYTFSTNIISMYTSVLPELTKKIFLAIFPIVVFFFIYNAFLLKLPKKYLTRIVFGLIYLFFGVLIFILGVEVGFSKFGNMLARELVYQGYAPFLVIIGAIVGFFVVAAEPAVHILNGQVEELSGGTIKKRSIMIALMIGMSLAVAMAMIRILTSISIWWLLVPGYTIALVLTFFVPKVFTAIAFDSGGVASGPMTATFLMPFSIGASLALGGNILRDAFGTVAMVAMTPLVTIQILGLISAIKSKRLAPKVSGIEEDVIDLDIVEEVIDFDVPKIENDDIIVKTTTTELENNDLEEKSLL